MIARAAGPAETLAGRIVDAEYAAAWGLVRALPAGLAHGAFRLGADLATRRGGAGVRRLRANLARVVPDASPTALDALVREGMRSYARYWCEAFRLPGMDPAAVHGRTRITGTEPFFEALDGGRGVIFAVPHSGNWDTAGVWVVETLRRLGREPRFTTVTQKLQPESVYRRFVDYRESLGFEVVAAEDGAAAYRALTRRLRAGGVVCLVADRDLTAHGVEVSFLGEPARFPAGPARLAALTGAVLMPAHLGFTPHGWRVHIAEPVPVPGRDAIGKATQAIADAFGVLIARAPQDWHALQPIWTADREAP
ncbi:phosphatidylinositol mannoside acyltransferase [Pseudonocardia nigra]|uniref:phosphatidylinositol mannoside acyltransferase n=1 Tax=Pseudonocardia nigra TaxID=1921578 RepID=UPI001C5FB824|nr:phosphatidylinositol mannoside acyltransferase [Pseudonocardia nigra]